MGDHWKMVRDGQRIFSESHGVSGSWRYATDDEAVRALGRKLIEEGAEYLEAGAVEELWDLQDVLDALMARLWTFESATARKEKAERLGLFSTGLMWCPVPGEPDGDPDAGKYWTPGER